MNPSFKVCDRCPGKQLWFEGDLCPCCAAKASLMTKARRKVEDAFDVSFGNEGDAF